MRKVLLLFSLVSCMTIHANESKALLTDASVMLVNGVTPIPLSVGKVNPTGNGKPFGRMPVSKPELAIDGHTLLLNKVYEGDILQLVLGDEVVYEYIFTESLSEITLPSDLEGEFEIKIIRGNFCFCGYIEL